MKRTVKKQFWFNREEAKDLQKKSKKACLTEAGLIRLLLKGYEPKEKPDDRFYHAMNQMSEFGRKLEYLELQKDNKVLLEKEVKRWHEFQADIENQFLRPEQKTKKWQ